jgi:hypothetical protein
LKAYLRIGEENEEDDALLTTFITSATRIIELKTTRRFESSSTSTRYFDADKSTDKKRMLYFDDDICSITSVVNGDGVTVIASNYTTQPRHEAPYYSIRLKDSANVDWTYEDTPEDAIAVTGHWAYSVTPPQDIVHACIRLASFLYRQKDNAVDVDRPLVGDGVMVMPIKLPADVDALLKPYTRLVQ